MGIRVVDTGGGSWPRGGGGNGGAGTSKSGGNAGTSVILGGPLLLMRVETGRTGRAMAGRAVFVGGLPLPWRNLTMPVIKSCKTKEGLPFESKK